MRVLALLILLQAAQDPEAEARKPQRRASVAVKELPYGQAASKIFGAYELTARVATFLEDTGIATLSLELKDASFWEAADRFCTATRLQHTLIDLPGEATPSLSFQNYGMILAWDTIGDVRVFCRSVDVDKQGRDFSMSLWIAAPFWAVPKKVRIEKVTIDGRPLPESDAGAAWADPKEGPPRKQGCITLAAPWRSAALPAKEARSVKVEGALRIASGDRELSLPFSIPEVEIRKPR